MCSLESCFSLKDNSYIIPAPHLTPVQETNYSILGQSLNNLKHDVIPLHTVVLLILVPRENAVEAMSLS